MIVRRGAVAAVGDDSQARVKGIDVAEGVRGLRIEARRRAVPPEERARERRSRCSSEGATAPAAAVAAAAKAAQPALLLVPPSAVAAAAAAGDALVGLARLAPSTAALTMLASY